MKTAEVMQRIADPMLIDLPIFTYLGLSNDRTQKHT